MQIFRQLTLALSGLSINSKWTPVSHSVHNEIGNQEPLPSKPEAIVLWHGLGDNYNTTSMGRIKELIENTLPDTFVHSVYIDEDPALDERRSIFGDANSELAIACEQLLQIPELSNGFAGIGFSQGGLFMRALIEKCPNISVSTLITFGSPHLGVLELPLCSKDDDWLCKRRNAFLKSQVWLPLVQKTVIPAQYFRDPAQYSSYTKYSHFLANINNERPEEIDEDAKERFSQIGRLVLIKFTKDTTLVPKESAFFEEVDPHTGRTVPFTKTQLFQDDLIGLRKLFIEDKVSFYDIDDEHMRFLDDFFVDILHEYFGAP